jgi:hypothetical protein
MYRMPSVGTSSSGRFARATATQHSLRDLRIKRKGQPVFVLGHLLNRKGQEATFEVFNDRIALVKFEDGGTAGYDPAELVLPTEIDEAGVAYFEIRTCRACSIFFPLTLEECDVDDEPTDCPDCRP